MNFLAHAYLSFGRPAVLGGNMSSDFIKGKRQYEYPAGIQTGIRLHRQIDIFTDDHPITLSAKRFFRPAYRLYAGPFVDIVYDHFLANDETIFPSEDSLADFCQHTYVHLQAQLGLLPEAFRRMFPYMQEQNWLYHYRFREGIKKSFNGLVRRSVYLEESALAYEIFNEHYDALQDCYCQFFPVLKDFAQQTLATLENA